jgi:methionine aminopeptidase
MTIHACASFATSAATVSAARSTDAGDGWTLVGPKGSVTAQYEHTLVVGRQGPIVVTNLPGLPGD